MFKRLYFKGLQFPFTPGFNIKFSDLCTSNYYFQKVYLIIMPGIMCTYSHN